MYDERRKSMINIFVLMLIFYFTFIRVKSYNKKCLRRQNMNIVPIFDRVVLLPKDNEQSTKSGIILPTASQEKSQIATVVAVGKGGLIDGKEVEMQVSVGDDVIYSKYAGTEFNVDEKKYIIVRQTDILAVVK